MTELCSNLLLSIWHENGEVRIKLVNELEMMETEICYPINPTTEKTANSSRYFVREATLLGLRQLLSHAFKEGLISDSPGSLRISKPITVAPSFTPSEIDLDF